MSELPEETKAEEIWRNYLLTGRQPAWFMSQRLRPVVRALPGDPRCRLCYYPFHGPGGALARIAFKIEPSRLNPQICNRCERYIAENQTGAEVEVTLLFADVRGSTRLAEEMSTADFSRLINRFYGAATTELFRSNALVEKLIGDEVTGFYVPGIAGPDHPRRAVEAAQNILRATGHGRPAGPWVPVGVGVHTGNAYVGAVTAGGGGGDIAVLGDAPNTGARLASLAGPGEVLLSEATRAAAGLDAAHLQPRQLQLKGRSEPVQAWVLEAGAEPVPKP